VLVKTFLELVDHLLGDPRRDAIQDVVYGQDYYATAMTWGDMLLFGEQGGVIRPAESDDPSNFFEEASLAWFESIFTLYGVLDVEAGSIDCVRLVMMRDAYKYGNDSQWAKTDNILRTMLGKPVRHPEALEVIK
jgi:hypothetical protein